ncbi:hypothetical protein [Stenotrophomonas sp. MA5]|jgi:hypothetical protein|uniref:hypothetical protein n=1 Tax=Stenotrophomonas sp. MA5 TaxID=2508572 RepID=UPI001009F181|nr:hypothetical protein [Stenotrophomonas sp. MA5]RXK67923.1 hypothetical protein ERT44_06760 [Stenotrophomonas sp. MA5]HEL5053426.1 hypothetical protein [Stenotrophomonas maltophilia]
MKKRISEDHIIGILLSLGILNVFLQSLLPLLHGVTQGDRTMADAISVPREVAAIADVIGLGIAEYLPWDAVELKGNNLNETVRRRYDELNRSSIHA